MKPVGPMISFTGAMKLNKEESTIASADLNEFLNCRDFVYVLRSWKFDIFGRLTSVRNISHQIANFGFFGAGGGGST
eukprot:CAMPEP_0168566888 /NCGR_PEP_ID=MMETSP0413-20121227/14677_1 /TAXON_ID=136452 /ORGANISM="Filamoeba nolandi, Strain NC-AS-23-1" /LENGTH=76 /DNA_ID=CAMNT_0008598973 /DNA_START=44 /DNA_END=270 /DNA_ORIENTATION=-